MLRIRSRHIRNSPGWDLARIAFLSLLLSSFANYVLAYWLGVLPAAPWRDVLDSSGAYRRVGPETGSQVFCAGSSLLVSGLYWPEVSDSLGRGIEIWTVGGSSPEIWEVFQRRRPKPALTIVGVSVYDLNEMRLTPKRAQYIPLTETIRDLSASRADPTLSRRIVAQYSLKYLRLLFPLAGDWDSTLVAVRREVAKALRLERRLDAYEGVVMERDGVLDADNLGENTTKLTDWSFARTSRRLAGLRAENHGVHEFFRGPKRLAFQRILLRARPHGPVIVVVLPVSKSYAQEFIGESTVHAFETALTEDMKIAPGAALVRLDQVAGISDDHNFSDLAHLNSYGRRLTTPAFLKNIAQIAGKQGPVTVSGNPPDQR